MSTHIYSETVVNAPAAVVWRILAAFDRYPEWNPFIRKIIGNPFPGAGLEIVVEPPGKRAVTFRPTLLVFEPEREIRWIGRILARGIFDGEHVLSLDPIDDDRVRFVHQEMFSGMLVPLFWGSLDVHTRAGFKAMNKALKRRAESGGFDVPASGAESPGGTFTASPDDGPREASDPSHG